jgi:saccharopine dehydrogenase-like NADP-dependent oxidoreductase
MQILLIGAGKSTSYLIDYLLEHSHQMQWNVCVADVDILQAQEKIAGHERATAVSFNVHHAEQRADLISSSDMVISMLPASMHGEVAKDCLRFGKHMITASYVSPEMRALDAEAKNKGLIFLNEAGLDPGIDHASAMKIIDEVHSHGGKVISFKSFCGGLVAPESNDNPWGYKFSWNPRNVILAGQGTAQWLEGDMLKFIPYNRLFTQTETISVEGIGDFDAYANRDSISYRQQYGLHDVQTMLRGTLRMPGYCRAWNVFIQLGLTDDSWKLPDWKSITWPKLLKAFLPVSKDVKNELFRFCGITNDLETQWKLEWLGIFDESVTINVSGKTPAQLLQELLEPKWKLAATDKDMIVMQHLFEGVDSTSKPFKIISSLVVKGENQTHTAMAKTVGLPLAICARMIANNKISQRGVIIPIHSEIYVNLLNELTHYGVSFVEKMEA